MVNEAAWLLPIGEGGSRGLRLGGGDEAVFIGTVLTRRPLPTAAVPLVAPHSGTDENESFTGTHTTGAHQVLRSVRTLGSIQGTASTHKARNAAPELLALENPLEHIE